ncbi:helix-turn-helix domain-containing protein [Acuticoccus sediminis]|uniref:helix-turn-helix domain-containing protein n=1 Tax=Acuticoccus sediminis TaxID=2184697 RepID=UPI001CFE389F|nr:AraC family transcriptional regulator [Acuticoccus sediminis]
MSFHFSHAFDPIAPQPHAAEILSGASLDDAEPVAHASGAGDPGDNRGSTLSVHLAELSLDLAISADAPPAGPAAAPESGREAVLIQLCRATPALSEMLGGADFDGGFDRQALADDPIVRRLTGALDEAAGSEDPSAGLYADALRLATLVRILSVQKAAARIWAPAAEPAPRPAPEATPGGLPKWRLKRVKAYLDEHLAEAVTLADMAAAAGLSRMYFAAQFRLATGHRPHEYLLKCRVERAMDLLKDTDEPVAQVAFAVGFQTQSHFTTVFRRFAGETPYRWRCAQSS